MRFMLLLKSDEQAEAGITPDTRTLAAMGQYNDDLARAGVLLAAEGLQPSAKGARLRLAAGNLTVTDGPFTETKELIAGFWVIQVPSREAAIAWAERCPLDTAGASGTSHGGGQIEVRQITELSDFPVNDDESRWREQQTEFRAALQEPPPVAVVEQPDAAPTGDKKLRFMMNFMADRDSEAGIPPSEQLLTEMGNLMAEMAQTGVLLAGEGLQPSAKAARVTFAGGKRTVTDGPFAETKELIAGYSLLRVGSKAEAIEWARRSILIDAPGRGGESVIELRQIFEPSDFGPEFTPELREAEERLRAQIAAKQ
ncbi:MAG: PhnB protein [uncultured Thermomicrobiales bacterium]|uniref:PhnB protein n=1 Tax=uncultured Thermomicrobiales bacterium TaxID=1645740 RepID=A0A6J4V0M8_9BACT|nr:MAG: PhnB protein [uncultured Thermomicrobiales bacterium]